MKPVRARERGMAIVLATGIIAMLIASALILVSQASNSMDIAGGIQMSRKARHIAEGASILGRQQLEALAYPLGASGGLTLAAIRALPRVPDGSIFCADTTLPCSAYRLLTATGPVNYGGGTYSLAVTCNPNPSGCDGAPGDVINFQLRALGTLPGGAHKLIALDLKPH